VVLEVFRFVQVRSRGHDSRGPQSGSDLTKTITAHMERVVGIVDELDAMGERMRQAALSLKRGEAQVMVRTARSSPTAGLTMSRKRSMKKSMRRL
jgi:hypothetical protein